jgi:putative transposase
MIGADPYERTAEQATYRNGHRSRLLDTGVSRVELEIPKLRTGTFFPALLALRRRIDRALLAVIQEAYVLGVSTPKVDALVAAMGGCSVSRSEVSRICAELDKELAAFRQRRIDDAVYPYVRMRMKDCAVHSRSASRAPRGSAARCTSSATSPPECPSNTRRRCWLW